MDQKLTVFSGICSILQIAGAGLFLMIFQSSLPSFVWILIGISGFAAVAKFFLPDGDGFEKHILRPIATFAGFGFVIISILSV